MLFFIYINDLIGLSFLSFYLFFGKIYFLWVLTICTYNTDTRKLLYSLSE